MIIYPFKKDIFQDNDYQQIEQGNNSFSHRIINSFPLMIVHLGIVPFKLYWFINLLAAATLISMGTLFKNVVREKIT